MVVVVGAVVLTTLRFDHTSTASLPTSLDGWSRVALDMPPDSRIESIVAGPHGLLAIARRDGDGPASLVVSADGRDWTTVPNDRAPGGWDTRKTNRIAATGTDEGFLMLLGDEAWTAKTGDGDWQRISSETGLWPNVMAVARGGPGYVAVGENDHAWYSNDGSDWTPAKLPPPPVDLVDRTDYPHVTVLLSGIAVAGDHLLASGWAGADNGKEIIGHDIVLTSKDGRTWTAAPAGGSDGQSIAGGPGGFVAIDLDPDIDGWRVQSSADGETWRRTQSDAFRRSLPHARPSDDAGGDRNPFHGISVADVAAVEDGYVAVGFEQACPGGQCWTTEAVIWTSADGQTWSRLPSDERFRSVGQWDSSGTEARWVVAMGSRIVIAGTYEDVPTIWISDGR